MYRRVAGMMALLLAVVVVANPLYLSFSTDEYYHSVERVSADDIPEEADLLAYPDLSENGKTAFRNAVEDDEGSYTVHRERNVPDEFFYSDNSHLGKGIYYVQYQGDHYRLNTMSGGGFVFVVWFYQALLAVFGVTLAAVGGRVLGYRQSPWSAVVLSLFAVALLVGSPLLRFPFGEALWKDAVMLAPVVGGVMVFVPQLRQFGDTDEA